MRPNKACPIILSHSHPPRILLFHHPLAGVQIVKGTIEVGEFAWQAALRELNEEAGIDCATVSADLGCWDADHLAQVWSFHLCDPRIALPERWTYNTCDGGGLAFEFFWAPFDDLPYDQCHPVFCRALRFLTVTLDAAGYLQHCQLDLND
ncbi:NUDIX hydrolase [Pseudomonas brassicacearum]|uniref:NUDIX domain-containing protein n=2 Tax=Pseudomonas brassicacearum TaxID=930166 RepID=A0AAJ3FX05_9PSED|nr:NUDIX domain-containing protein [Pseudomonas brassicacearum]NUT81367.1 NUDIX domain-containing protein [Pseudomonas brassicacearum]QGA50427.1 NUDIX domain-containing protein [Pseudomonas brassicacearum]